MRLPNPISCFVAALLLFTCAPQAAAQSGVAPEAGARSAPPPPAPREDFLLRPVHLEWRSVDRTVGECSDPVWGCARFIMRYPFAPSWEPGAGADSVSRLAEEWALSPWQAAGKRLPGAEAASKSFFTSYRQYRHNNPDKPQRWDVHRVVSVVHSTARLLSMRYEARSSLGGRQLEDGVLLATVDLQTGKKLALGDLVKPEGAERLRTVAETEFRSALRLGAAEPLPPAIFRGGEKFSLPENFLAGPAGLTFRYNVKGGAASPGEPVELSLPYHLLEGILRTSGPLTGLAR